MTQTLIPKGCKLLATVPFSGQGRYMCHQIWAGDQEVTNRITWVPSVLPCLRYATAALTSDDRGATHSRLEITLRLPASRHRALKGPGSSHSLESSGTSWALVGLRLEAGEPQNPGVGGQKHRLTQCVWGDTGGGGKQGHPHSPLWVPRPLNYARGGQCTVMITDAQCTLPPAGHRSITAGRHSHAGT